MYGTNGHIYILFLKMQAQFSIQSEEQQSQPYPIVFNNSCS